MEFNSLSFIVFFIAACLPCWLMPSGRGRLAWLVLASCLFYAASGPASLLLLAIITAVNYAAAMKVAAARAGRPQACRLIVAAAVLLDLGNLALFKYANFFLEAGGGLVSAFMHIDALPRLTGLFIPLGISFYTFQLIAYIVDVGRGACEPIADPLEMALFASFFPKMSAGPIIRTKEFIPQLKAPAPLSCARLLQGADLIFIGLFKKIIIADQIAPFADKVFAAPDGLGFCAALLGVYTYTVQIYCDFSGYMDIALGCACLLGFQLPPNFNFPYLSVNIIDFWRRWHMTLSGWLRDYLYIPLGGSRGGRLVTYRNLFITMALAGLWHGANWTFVVWGLWHGAALILTRYAHDLKGVAAEQPLFSGKLYRALAMAITFHVVGFGWVFFRAPDCLTALKIFKAVFSFRLFGPSDLVAFGVIQLSIMAATLAALFFMQIGAYWGAKKQFRSTWLWGITRPAVYFLIIALIALMANQSAKQFIYFQF